MSFECSYAGVPFQLSSPELSALIGARMPLWFLRQLVPPPRFPGRTISSVALPLWPDPPMPEIGQFFYPVGAARWATFHGLMTQANVKKLLPLIQDHSNGHTSQRFVLRADATINDDTTKGITTQMFMLPPRPLFQVDQSLRGLYWVTLVDERYWPKNSANVPLTSQAITWANLVSQLSTARGITLDQSTVPTTTAYGSPSLDSGLWANNEDAGVLLDAVAWNLGCFAVRAFDGTYTLQPFGGTPYVGARRSWRSAGGPIMEGSVFSPDASGQVPQLELILPRRVLVTFPCFVANYSYLQQQNNLANEQPVRYIPWIKDSYHQVYTVTTSLGSATAQDNLGNPLSNYAGIDTEKTLHTTARAYFANFSDASPSNLTAMQSLASQLANDHWSYLANGGDEMYAGIRNWPPDQTHDILCVYRHDACYTRLQRLPWNCGVISMSHALTGSDGPNAGPAIELVRCNVATPDASGRYDAYTRRQSGSTYSDVQRVWLRAPNGETLANNSQYGARLMAYENGRPSYTACGAGTGGGGTPLTVQKSDGSGAISNVNTIELDLPADWTLTNPSAGHARMATAGQTGSLQVCSPDGTTHTITWSNGITKTVV